MKTVQVPVSLIERISTHVERVADHVAHEYEADEALDALVIELRALLSQQTPPAEEFEPGTRVRLTAEGAEGYSKASWAKDNTGIVTRELPLGDGSVRSQPRVMVQWYGHEWEAGTLTSRLERVEQVTDMVPGTRFTGSLLDSIDTEGLVLRFRVIGPDRVQDDRGNQWTAGGIDQSTIRDVKAPKETP